MLTPDERGLLVSLVKQHLAHLKQDKKEVDEPIQVIAAGKKYEDFLANLLKKLKDGKE